MCSVFTFSVYVSRLKAQTGVEAGAEERPLSLRCFDYNTGTGREKRATYPRHVANSVCCSFRTRINRLLSCCGRRDIGEEEEEEKAVDTADRHAGDQATGASACPFLDLNIMPHEPVQRAGGSRYSVAVFVYCWPPP